MSFGSPFSNPQDPQNPFNQGPTNPFQQPSPSNFQMPQGVPTKTSPLAIVSLISGFFSAPFFCCICIGFLPSVCAIITGHIALSQINRSQGTLTGRGLAITGLGSGYLFFVLTILLFALGQTPDFTGKGIDPANAAPGSAEFKKAEMTIASSSKGIAHGNSPEAKALAKEFAENMLQRRQLFFTKKNSIFKDKPFVTYCELRDGKCAFVVSVPDYRKFEADAKKSLAELAWMTAHECASERLKRVIRSPSD